MLTYAEAEKNLARIDDLDLRQMITRINQKLLRIRISEDVLGLNFDRREERYSIRGLIRIFEKGKGGGESRPGVDHKNDRNN